MRRTRARRLDWFFALDKQNRFYYLSHHHISAKFARFVFESDNDQLVREAALEQVASDLSAPWRVAYLSKILHENSNNDIGKCAAHALEHIKLEWPVANLQIDKSIGSTYNFELIIPNAD